MKHKEYYHLGKYLKEAVHRYGKLVHRKCVEKFYHGISKQLMFPRYENGIDIKGPLSTSTFIQVAYNFTNRDEGLIVTFLGRPIGIQNRYFPCSWLSDYPN